MDDVGCGIVCLCFTMCCNNGIGTAFDVLPLSAQKDFLDSEPYIEHVEHRNPCWVHNCNKPARYHLKDT
jgi:hypothetical protein